MQNKETQEINPLISSLDKEKSQKNIFPLINKSQLENRYYYNIINIQNNDIDNFKSEVKLCKHTNPSK